MGNQGVQCPKCKNYISYEEIRSHNKGDIESFYKKEKEKIEKKNKELEKREEENKNENEKIKTKNIELKNKEKELNIKEKKLIELKEKLYKEKENFENNQKKEKSIKEKQYKIDIKNKDETEYYDIIVCIDSILGIESGWKIKCNEKGKDLYEKMKYKELVKVGVVGLRNKGKS